VPLMFVANLRAQTFDSLWDEINDKPTKKQIEILNDVCWQFRAKNPVYALKSGSKAIELAEKLNNYSLLAKSHNLVGVVQRNMGYFGKAMDHYQNALKYAQTANDSVQIAYSYNNIGGIHRMQRQFTLALENIYKAATMFEKLKMEKGLAFCYINIGIIYRERKDFKKAIEYLNKTIEIRKKIGDKFGITLALSHLAEVYFQQGKEDLTYNTYLKLLKSYRELDDPKGIAYVYGSMSILLEKQKNYSEAVALRKHSLEIQRKIKNKDGELISLSHLVKLYSHMGEFKNAKAALDELSNSIKNTDMVLAKQHFLSARSEYYFAIGDFNNAYKSYKEFVEYKDSLAAQEDEVRISAIENMYNVERVNKEKELLQKDIEIANAQQRFLIIIIVIGIVLLGIILYNIKKTRERNKELMEVNLNKDRLFSIIAHDLKNPFNSILGYSDLLVTEYESFSDEERREAIKEMNSSAKKLFDLVSNLLEWSRAQSQRMTVNLVEIDLKKELKNIVDLYEPIAEKKNITLQLKTKENTKIECDENIFHTIFRNLINNAIKFTPENGSIEISIKLENNWAHVSVKDSGVGIPEEKINKIFDSKSNFSTSGTANESGTGLGLLLVKELVDRMKGKIKVESEVGKGTTFTVCFPR
ncbi:MAG: hypothetical protein D6830_03260, partial [Ignavibacteria bacterium]